MKVLSVAAAAALILGFMDLIRGGITLSAILLAAAYCVLIPLAIWRSRTRATERTEGTEGTVRNGRGGRRIDAAPSRPSYKLAAMAAGAVLLLYILTLAPTTAMWDASEYIAAAYVFGLPHPPGNPFFVIIGRVFTILPIASDIGARVNILAALSSAVAAGVWFLTTERVLSRWLRGWQLVAGASMAVLIGATAFTVWNQSVVSEKVYTVSLAGIALVSWLAIRWLDSPDEPASDRYLVLIAYLCGLGYANHMAGMMAAPAVAVAVLLHRPRTFLRWRLILACAGVLALGVTPFATQPIRAAHQPAINEGAPTGCRTQLELSCTFSGETYELFMDNLNRGQYAKPKLSERQAPFAAQLGMWWLYFKWQWTRDAFGTHPGLQSTLAAIFLILALAGGYVHWRRDRRSFTYFAPLMLMTTLVLIYYLNFKYGFSQAPHLGGSVPREVRDRDYFFMWSFSSWGVWAAIGLVVVWQWLASLIASKRPGETEAPAALPPPRAWRAATPVLLIALVPLFMNWSAASRRGDRVTIEFARDMLNSVEPYGVLIVVGDNDTFPLWYAQEVEGIRKDVVVANTSLLGTQWYPRQIINREIFEYDTAQGPAIYRGRHWPKPDRSPLELSLDQADAIAPYYGMSQPMAFDVGPISATIDPRNLEYGVLTRADYFVLNMIRDGWSKRPLYFARSANSYAAELGFGQFILSQGLASKLFAPPDSASAPRDTLYMENTGWLDAARTRALWKDVFRGHESLLALGKWVDRPSRTIPYLYAVVGSELAYAESRQGNSAAASQMENLTLNILRVVR